MRWRFANHIRMVHGRHLLADWIARSGLQKRHVAERIGISPSEVSHLLSGRRGPTLALAIDIHRETGIPPASWVPTARGRMGKPRKAHMKSSALA